MQKQWRTTTEYVDRQTGEIITKEHLLRGEYIKLKLYNKTYNTDGKYNIRKFTFECEKNRQGKLEL